MKQRIFESNYQCPCNAENDLKESINVFVFLEELYGDLSIINWEKYNLTDLECAYCLIQSALKIAESDKQKYNKRRISTLINAKNCITELFLEKTLDRIREFINKS